MALAGTSFAKTQCSAVGEGQLVNFVQNSYKSPFTCVHAASEKGNKMKVNMTRKSGFTLVEIMIVVAIIGLLAAIAIPNFVKARSNSQTNACIANMKQIEGAKATWALEAKKNNTDTPAAADLFGATQYIRVAPVCPSGTTAYTLSTVATPQVCPNVAVAPLHVLP